jgi:hypothetical protein
MIDPVECHHSEQTLILGGVPFELLDNQDNIRAARITGQRVKSNFRERMNVRLPSLARVPHVSYRRKVKRALPIEPQPRSHGADPLIVTVVLAGAGAFATLGATQSSLPQW